MKYRLFRGGGTSDGEGESRRKGERLLVIAKLKKKLQILNCFRATQEFRGFQDDLKAEDLKAFQMVGVRNLPPNVASNGTKHATDFVIQTPESSLESD